MTDEQNAADRHRDQATDVELAPGPAVMAGIYMVAYALGRPTAAWAAWPSLVVVLHAIREHHHDIYAGAWVNPYTAALEAGLDPDSSHYRVAMEYLQAEDVLEEAEESRELGEGGPLYTITLRGMEMLREV